MTFFAMLSDVCHDGIHIRYRMGGGLVNFRRPRTGREVTVSEMSCLLLTAPITVQKQQGTADRYGGESLRDVLFAVD